MIAGLLVACPSDFTVTIDPPPTPLPPPQPQNDDGAPPDWTNCYGGFNGRFFNLEVDHPQVEPLPGADPITTATTPDDVDWYEDRRLAFERYDAGLDMGTAWYPVDQGWAGDPSYFSVRWNGWMRVWRGTTWRFTLGSADDAWVVVGGAVVAALPGVHPFEPGTFSVGMQPGQFPVEIYYAHRSGSPAFSFRSLNSPEEITLCYPDYEAE